MFEELDGAGVLVAAGAAGAGEATKGFPVLIWPGPATTVSPGPANAPEEAPNSPSE